MPLLYWNLDTGIVSATMTGQAPVQFQATRGTTVLQLVFLRGYGLAAAPVQLDAGQTVGVAIRDPENLKEDYAGGPATLTRGATAADGFLGTVSTDTTFVREIMHVEDTDQANELSTYDVSAAFYYEPTSGGDDIESLPFTWTILPNYYRAGQPPADIVNLYPSGQQMTAAIVLAGAAQPKLPTATANGQVLFGNTDGSYSFGAFPSSFPGNLTIAGTISGASFSGSGAGLTSLPAAQLTGTVPLGALPAAVAGSLHYKGAWNAATNTPPLASGVGELGGYYVVSTSGTTAIDGGVVWTAGDWIVFDGTRWDKLDGAANPVASVDGQTGAVTLATDSPANVGSKRTLGAGALQAAPGNDGRFPASVAGLRKGAGAGGADTAATAGVDFLAPNGSGAGLTGLAPFHANGVATFAAVGSGSQNGTSVYGDATGTFTLQVNGSVPAGSTVGTITFGTPYPNVPLGVLLILISSQHGTPTSGTPMSPGLIATATNTVITLKLAQDVTNSAVFQCQYFVLAA